MTTLSCLFCSTALDSQDAVRDHNQSSCWAKRRPEPPHQLQAILPTKRLPRWWILADRENRDELRGHHSPNSLRAL